MTRQEYLDVGLKIQCELGISIWTQDMLGMIVRLPTEALEYCLSTKDDATEDWSQKWLEKCEEELAERALVEHL